MDERIRRRRRSINRQRGRRRISIVFPVLLLVCAAGLFLWLRSTDVFAVKTISVTATDRVSAEEISQVASEVVGESLLSLSTGSLEEGLMGLPYVRTADVHRAFPNGLEIEITEYDPAARLQAKSGEIWLVAENGRVLEGADASAFPELPLVVPDGSFALTPGEQVPDAVAEALSLAPLLEPGEVGSRLPSVERVTVSAAGYVAVRLAEGTELRLGDPVDLEQKLMVAVDIIKQCAKDGKALEYLDASVPDRVAVKAK